MKEKVVVDTSFWIALLLKSDSQHQKAKNLYDDWALRAKTIFSNQLIIAEVSTVLTRLRYKEMVKPFYTLLGSRWVRVPSIQLSEYSNFFVSLKDNKLSFQDSTIIYDAYYFDCDIVTFDKEILKIQQELEQ